MTEIPNIKLNNGLEMPVFGLGTWQGAPGCGYIVAQAVKDAIDIGYRLFDCAHIYGNEKEIGQAIQDKIKEGVVKREELFITSKLWCDSHKPDLVEPALKTTLKNLQLNELDLYLIHWPMDFCTSADGKYQYTNVDYLETWKAMELVYRKKLTKSIGVSNFNSKQIDRILNICTVFPQVNQVECHPYLNQLNLRKYCDNNGIIIMAYSPLGGSNPNTTSNLHFLNDDRIKEIAKRYQKTTAQIVLKFNIQLGNVVIPKSANKNRLLENIEIFDFYLAPEDMSFINTFDCNGRVCRLDMVKDHVYYPFSPDVKF